METNEILAMMSNSSTANFPLTGTVSTGSSIGVLTTGTTGSSITTHQVTLPEMENFVGLALNGYWEQKKESDSKSAVTQLEKIISKLSNTDNENQLNAVKHLTYAKAYLEKMLLDIINQKTNGDSKPD
jgi:hypothetical protein